MGLRTIPRARPEKPCDGDHPELRRSKRSRWRALVLVLVHVAIAAHILHWRATGATVTPVEPSEAMQTLELGYVNAGFILFAALILSTLVFGRFFCGWGCHVVALQDLCGWLLKRFGIRPKPFRSRLLVFVPLFAALYMFVWPSALRIWEGREAPAWTSHLTTEDFWATFPGPGIAVLTLVVCGFLAVLLLGNKGFCTYGCPYGAFFYHADRFAPGKIRVTDACEGCGHCTATCTSNVRVHEEVRTYGMVVDSGCMKCMDCVDVCPKGALYFGFGKPSVAAPRPARLHSARKYDFTAWEELGLAVWFAVGLYAYRGLFESVPFLLSLGLGSITAVVLVFAARLAYAPSVRLQRLQLRTGGKLTRAGLAFGAVAASIVLFLAYASVLQFHVHESNRHLLEAERHFASGNESLAERSARESIRQLEWARGRSPFTVALWEAKLGSMRSFLREDAEAAALFSKALSQDPSIRFARVQLGQLHLKRRSFAEAEREFLEAARRNPGDAQAANLLAQSQTALGKNPEAVETLRRSLARHPRDAIVRMNYGMALSNAGRLSEGLAELKSAARLAPGEPAIRLNLGLALAQDGEPREGAKEIDRAVELAPNLLAAHAARIDLALSMGDTATAVAHATRAKALAPFEPSILSLWTVAIQRAGKLDEEIRRATALQATDNEAGYAAVFLYHRRGDIRTSEALFRRLRARLPALSPP